MRETANGRRIYALADYTVERTGKGWYFGRTSRFGDTHAMKASATRTTTNSPNDRGVSFRTMVQGRPIVVVPDQSGRQTALF